MGNHANTTACIKVYSGISLCAFMMEFLSTLAAAFVIVPLFPLVTLFRLWLGADAATVSVAPFLWCATRVFLGLTTRLTVTATPLRVPLLVLVATAGSRGAPTHARGVVQHSDCLITKRLKVLRDYLELTHVAWHTGFYARLDGAHRALTAVQPDDVW